jgi:cytochrome c2
MGAVSDALPIAYRYTYYSFISSVNSHFSADRGERMSKICIACFSSNTQSQTKAPPHITEIDRLRQSVSEQTILHCTKL